MNGAVRECCSSDMGWQVQQARKMNSCNRGVLSSRIGSGGSGEREIYVIKAVKVEIFVEIPITVKRQQIT